LADLEAQAAYLLGVRRGDQDRAPPGAGAGADKNRTDAEAIGNMLREAMDKNAALTQQAAREREEMTAWKVRAESAEARMRELEKEMERLARDNQKLRSGAPDDPKKEPPSNPPAEAVEGLVKEVDASGLVRLSIGADAGLAKGNTLEVYRLGEDLKQARYL